MSQTASTGSFYGVGLGPGDPGLVTIKALQTLKDADVIFTAVSGQSENSVSASIINALPDIRAARMELVFAMKTDWNARLSRIGHNADIILEHLKRGLDCVFATIGDPMTYSTCSYLVRALLQREPGLRTKFVPGVNSWSALAAAAGQPLVEDEQELRIIPAFRSAVLERDNTPGVTSVYLKTYHSRDAVLGHNDGKAIIYGERLGLEDEFITSSPSEVAGRPPEYLSMIIAKDKESSHD